MITDVSMYCGVCGSIVGNQADNKDNSLDYDNYIMEAPVISNNAMYMSANMAAVSTAANISTTIISRNIYRNM